MVAPFLVSLRSLTFQPGLSKLLWKADSAVTRFLIVQMQTRPDFHFDQSLTSKRKKPMTGTRTLILRFLSFTRAAWSFDCRMTSNINSNVSHLNWWLLPCPCARNAVKGFRLQSSTFLFICPDCLTATNIRGKTAIMTG